MTEVVRHMYNRTEGNPLFLVNMIEQQLAQGQLVVAGDSWRLESSVESLSSAIPQTLQQFILQQLDCLEEPQQRVLKAASMVGREFTTRAVATALTRAVEEVCGLLADQNVFISEQGIVEWPDGSVSARYAFHIHQVLSSKAVSIISHSHG